MPCRARASVVIGHHPYGTLGTQCIGDFRRAMGDVQPELWRLPSTTIYPWRMSVLARGGSPAAGTWVAQPAVGPGRAIGGRAQARKGRTTDRDQCHAGGVKRVRPSGTVTFLFTDVVDSTRWWDSYPEQMRLALVRHDEIVRSVVDRYAGYVFSTGGDSFAVAFDRVVDALGAAVEAQRHLGVVSWPEPVTLQVRMSLHSGEASERDGDYFGPAVNRAARLLGLASGGAVLCSEATAQLLRGLLPDGASLLPVGVHRLKGLADPERVFAVVDDGLITSPVVGHGLEGNLPRPLSRLIGRAWEVGEVADLVGMSPVVTLTGPGGVGKTTLALHAARSLTDKFADGLWWLELAPIGHDGDVVRAAATTLAIRDEGGLSLLDTVCDALGQRQLLIVVDNCEHVANAAREMVTALAQRCAGVTVLTTSRERLGVPGERVFPVHPLATATAQDAAMELLLERIDRRDLADDPVEMTALLQICRSLDGLPLALELAAARCVGLQPSDVAARLESRLRLLTDGRRVEARHRTVVATIDWSYSLLDERERLVFERLGVCSGWDLQTAESICIDAGIDTWEVDAALGALVDKSLVEHEGRWYRMLETTRAFALEQLAARGALAFRQDLHMAHFIEFARAAMAGVRSPAEARWLELLDVHWDNLRSAFRRAMDTGNADAATTLVAHLSLEGQWRRSEALAWRARDALRRFGSDRQPFGHVLLGAAGLAEWMRGDVARCAELGLRAMSIDPAPGASIDLLPEASAAYGLAWTGRFPEAKPIVASTLSLLADAGDRWNEMMWNGYRAIAEHVLGDASIATGAAQRASALAADIGAPTAVAWGYYVLGFARCGSEDECLQWLNGGLDEVRTVDNIYLEALILIERAGVVLHRDPTHALESLVQVSGDLQRTGRIIHSWSCLATVAEALIELGDPDNAARLFGAVRASPYEHMMTNRIDTITSAIDACLGTLRRHQLMREGAAWDFSTAAANCLMTDWQRANNSHSSDRHDEIGPRSTA